MSILRKTKKSIHQIILGLFLAGCGQEQSQSLSITPDQLGSVTGTVYLEILSGGIIPYSSIRQREPVSCSYHEDLASGTRTNQCTGIYQVFDAFVEYNFSNYNDERIESCDSDPRCQTSGRDEVDLDGTYSLTNLLVGDYRVNINVQRGDPSVGIRLNQYACEYIQDDGREIPHDRYYDMSFRIRNNQTLQTVGTNTRADLSIPTELHPTSCNAFCQEGTFRCEVAD